MLREIVEAGADALLAIHGDAAHMQGQPRLIGTCGLFRWDRA